MPIISNKSSEVFNIPTENCKFCKKEFVSNGRKFCKQDCYFSFLKKDQIQLSCSFCKKKFSVSINRSKGVKHCSRRCYIDAANKAKKRICKDCKTLKPISEFHIHALDKDIRRRYCISCEKKRVKKNIQKPEIRWKHSIWRSANSGEIWEIPLKEYKELLSQQCHYCDGNLNPTGCGLDRKDNEKGYILDNVVSCCYQCNIIKNHFFTYEEMILLSPIIKQIKANRHLENDQITPVSWKKLTNKNLENN